LGYESENSYLVGDLSLNMLRDFPLMDMSRLAGDWYLMKDARLSGLASLCFGLMLEERIKGDNLSWK